MALTHLANEFKTLSIAAKVGIVGALLAVILLIAGGVHLYHRHVETTLTKQQEQLKADNQKITDNYNQALGQAKANELAAREEKMKADAVIATIDAHQANVKNLDTKLEQVNKKYEEAKSSLGDCADADDCARKLCAELRAAGFKVKDCPD